MSKAQRKSLVEVDLQGYPVNGKYEEGKDPNEMGSMGTSIIIRIGNGGKMADILQCMKSIV